MQELHLRGVTVRFPGLSTPVLDIDEFLLPAGGQLAITGASGSGKSTLINVITGLERVTQGSVEWNGVDITRLSESGKDRWRGANVGLVMQDFHLFPGLSAIDNILLPARLARVLNGDGKRRAHELMERVGLARAGQAIETMSRGEMQRVAVARALLRKPGIIVADEPTASLDAESGIAVGQLLIELATAENSTLIVVSHDAALTNRIPQRVSLTSGRIVRTATEKMAT